VELARPADVFVCMPARRDLGSLLLGLGLGALGGAAAVGALRDHQPITS
jgi:hypothetical protein